MKSLLPQKLHYYIFVFSITVLVVGMPLSKFLMSISQIILICNWVLSGHLKQKLSDFYKNKAALVLSSLLLMHMLGALYSTDLKYAWNDIRIKIPVALLPLILSTSYPLEKKVVEGILKFFIASIFAGTMVSTSILVGIIHRPVLDIRDISIYISHIRFALLICIAIFSCVYLALQTPAYKHRFIYLSIVAWLLVFLVLLESVTGLITLTTAVLVFLVYKVATLQQRMLKLAFFALMLGTASYVGSVALRVVKNTAKTDVLNMQALEKYTAKGNLYRHDSTSIEYTENGHYIWLYYCEPEIKEAWNKRSKLDFNWKDKKGNVLRYTLVRYLTSRNLRKDAAGMEQLSDDEIRAIERGVTNVNYQNVSSLEGRLHEILWEIQTYRETGDANGHSLTQRFEYWKTAAGIIQQNALVGVGTGDVQLAFDEQYEKTNSRLQKQFRFRAHNQYLSITVAFGLIGLVWFLVTLIYPMFKLKKTGDFLYVTFFVVATVSFLTEDTLETQAGVTFYAFFNTFFLFCTQRASKRSV